MSVTIKSEREIEDVYKRQELVFLDRLQENFVRNSS